jgi:hypothetical protein
MFRYDIGFYLQGDGIGVEQARSCARRQRTMASNAESAGINPSVEFCCLNFYPFLATPPMVFRERPFASLAQFQRFLELAPFTPYVMANPGIRWARLSDLIAEAKLLGSKYCQEFMRPFNSRYEMALLFWDGAFFQGLVGLHRAERHGDFNNSEISLLLRLYEHFQNGLRRVLRIQREKAIRGTRTVIRSVAVGDNHPGLGVSSYLSESGPPKNFVFSGTWDRKRQSA